MVKVEYFEDECGKRQNFLEREPFVLERAIKELGLDKKYQFFIHTYCPDTVGQNIQSLKFKKNFLDGLFEEACCTLADEDDYERIVLTGLNSDFNFHQDMKKIANFVEKELGEEISLRLLTDLR